MTPEELRNIRSDLGLSQAKIADTLGVCRRSIQYYESGEKPIPKPIKKLLLAIFSRHKQTEAQAWHNEMQKHFKGDHELVFTKNDKGN